MRLTLIHPPLDDPTLPYHSTAYLKGHLVQSGFHNVGMRDLNVEFVDYCLHKDQVSEFYQEGQRRIQRFTSQPYLSLQEQEEYLGLCNSRRVHAEELSAATRELRQRESFLDYSCYLKNVDTVNSYFSFISALSYPSTIRDFHQACFGNYSIYNLGDLFNLHLSERICYPLLRFFEDRIAHDPELMDSDQLGISIVYDHQMSYALCLTRALRQRWPEKRIVLGGTAISQFYKYMKNKADMSWFFKVCDAIVVGEGETAICEIVNTPGDLTGKAIPNTITYDRGKDRVHLPARIHYENLPTLGTPVYEHPWDLYLSPERGINYAPTRGCYWNRCTFCDYGLNTDRPTSPWRERKIDQVISDLQEIKAKSQAKYIYFAVDVMAPGYLERMSDSILHSGLDIRWAAELRLEKIFSPERCKKIAQSGCVAISVGMESGNQRVLDLIDKGTKVAYMGDTMKNFSEAGIAVQLMAFKGFPGETPEEEKATYDFVQINQDSWSTGGIGTFVLTGTAMVARNPGKFGIRLLDTKDVDIARSVAFAEEGGSFKGITSEESDSSFDERNGVFPEVLGRPWAGGTDSLHSMIFYDAYGRKFFRENSGTKKDVGRQNSNLDVLECTIRISGSLFESPFSLSEMQRNHKLHIEHNRQVFQSVAAPTYPGLCEWEQTLAPVMNTPYKRAYGISNGLHWLEIHPLIYRILSECSGKTAITLGKALKGMDNAMRDRVVGHIDKLKRSGLIALESEAATPDALNANESVEAYNLRVLPAGISYTQFQYQEM
jgi:anaerobic magnesium-protoporphyrin IX monomethyl ester cyclase